jgi:hypothetical protein
MHMHAVVERIIERRERDGQRHYHPWWRIERRKDGRQADTTPAASSTLVLRNEKSDGAWAKEDDGFPRGAKAYGRMGRRRRRSELRFGLDMHD